MSMQKPSFFNRQATAVTALFHGATLEELIARARTAEFQGADGIAVDLFRLPPEQRTEDNFRHLMREVRLPFMFLCYRNDQWFGQDDEARQACLLAAAAAGAEVIDVMGDLYAPSPDELTLAPAAIARQTMVIAEIHARGAKALISSHQHTLPARSTTQVLETMRAQRARGADICKLVAAVNAEEELLEAIKTTMTLNREMDVPFIHLTNGPYSRVHRFLGLSLGVAITFGVIGYEAGQLPSQPTIAAFKAVQSNLHWNLKHLSP